MPFPISAAARSSGRTKAEYLEGGCKKPKREWRIARHEKFGYCKDTLCHCPYDGERSVKAVLEGFALSLWPAPPFEGEHVIGLKGRRKYQPRTGAASWNCPAAPLETTTRPQRSERTPGEGEDIADEIGVGFIGLGAGADLVP